MLDAAALAPRTTQHLDDEQVPPEEHPPRLEVPLADLSTDDRVDMLVQATSSNVMIRSKRNSSLAAYA